MVHSSEPIANERWPSPFSSELRANRVRRSADQSDHDRIHPVEERLDRRELAVSEVDEREDDDNRERGRHERHPRDQRSRVASPHPPQEYPELRGRGAGEHVADREPVHERVLVRPLLAVDADQLVFHERDVDERTAEADEPQFEEEAGDLDQLRARR